MSRSRKKRPYSGITTAESEKDDKRIWHRRLRARERTAITSCRDWEELAIPLAREVSNPWSMEKDGKHYLDGWRLEHWYGPPWWRK